MTETYKKSRIIAGIILILFWGSIAVFVFQRLTTSSPSAVFPTPFPEHVQITSDSASMLAFTPVIQSPTPTPLGFRINAMPNFTPTPTLAPVNPLLSVMPFTDLTGVAGSTFTLSGTSDPYAEVTIQFEPDGIGTITTAGKDGAWRYILTTQLSKGTKQLTVTARTVAGGKTEIKQSFTIKNSGSSLSSIFIGFFLLGGIGVVGFFIYKKQQEKQSLLLSDFPPVDDESGGAF